MAIRTDSYGSTTEVKALVRHVLDGQSAFNSTTRPTNTEVEKFIDRASGTLNVALRQAGFTPPVTNTTAKLACDDWVVYQVARAVELTARALSGFGEGSEERPTVFARLSGAACDFVKDNARGFKYAGVTVSHAASEGLAFTGEKALAHRADPDDDSLKQPRFHAEMFIESNET